jgi:energy-converting hydrogenase Eha subunit C
MHAQPLDRITLTALLASGLLFALAGAGWAYWGTDIFLSAIMSGLSYCGF